MRRKLPIWSCAALGLLATVLICWPFSNYYWCVWLVDGPSPETGGHPTYISGTGTDIAVRLSEQLGFEDPAAFLDAFVGVLLAISLFAILRHFFGRSETHETICRRCRSELRGLIEPVCPACGEHL
jgi:hypothetical protein